MFFLSEWLIRLGMLTVVPFRRTPAAAKAWLLLIFLEPWVGLTLYLLIGRPAMPHWRTERMAKLPGTMAHVVDRLTHHPNVFHPELSPELSVLGHLVKNLGRMPVLGGNAVELLVDYDAILGRLVADIDQAQNHVHLLFYLFAVDAATGPVIAALGRAVRRGVACRVLVDSLGSRSALPTLLPQLRSLGVQVNEMLPVGLFGHKTARLDLRNHRKIAIFDGRIAYTGSQNLVAADFKEGILYEELVLRIIGPAVLELQFIFAADWFLETTEVLDSDSVFPGPDIAGSIPVQALPSGPDFPTQNNQRLIISLIHGARKRVDIVTPYFIPDEPLLQALQTSVLRGVDIHLVLSERAHQLLVSLAQNSYYEELLEAGVKILLYRNNFLHAKFLTIDDSVSLVGSSNMDIRSFVLNAEQVLVIYDASVTECLQAELQRYIFQCRPLVLEQWRRRPFRLAFAEHLSRLLSPLL
jgi:cardiolipin synthase